MAKTTENKKMKKQEFLDKTPENNNETATQQMLIGLNKTQMINALRSLKQIHTVLYKTQLRSLSFQEILDGLELATKLETDESNNLEN